VTANSDTFSNTNNTGVGKNLNGIFVNGVFNGGPITSNTNGLQQSLHDQTIIKLDSGYDTGDSAAIASTSTVKEDNFLIYMDDRLLKLRNKNGQTQTPVTVDDDNIAIYNARELIGHQGINVTANVTTPLAAGGYLNLSLEFKLGANSTNLISSYLFDRMGNSTTMSNQTSDTNTTQAVSYIDTIVRVVGQAMGSSMDIPVRVVKI
jgi:hypothetical protein